MSSKSTSYGLIGTVIVTAVSGFVYVLTKSKLAALRDAGDGTVEEVEKTIRTANCSLAVLAVAGFLTVILVAISAVRGRRSGQ